MNALTYDTKLDNAIARGYLIGKHNVVVEASTGRRVSGSHVTHEWSRSCDANRLPDLIVDPSARGAAQLRLDLAQAGTRLRREDVDALNTEFWPVAKGRWLMAPFTEVHSQIRIDVTHLEAVLTRLRDAIARAIPNR